MNCAECEPLVHAYLDGELDAAESLRVEHHLSDCRSCAAERDSLSQLSRTIKSKAPYFTAPDTLRARLQSRLRAEAAPRRRLRMPDWLRPQFAATLAASVVLGSALTLWLAQPSAEQELAREVFAGHVRSLMVDHLADVASTDRHTVKPWFNGRLDFSPPVIDLAEQQFPLTGGRLDLIGGKAVAALVYKHREHVINVFVWPTASAGESDAHASVHQGYHAIDWRQGGMTFWAVSDLNAAELAEFVRLLRAQRS